MAGPHADPDLRSIVDAAAASWLSQRSASPSADRSSSARDGSQPTPSLKSNGVPAAEDLPSIRSDITAWTGALQSLPEEFRNNTLPVHPLAQALADQPTLRPVEWNQYRQQGGFVPRTPHDYSSLMIFISGQVNPNPCRNCLLRNGPFARCVVSPPSVLAQSTLRHACANCTYQNQYKKCTNAPISQDEMARSQMARAVMKMKNPVPRNLVPRKPRTNSRSKILMPDYGHLVKTPAALNISVDSFAEKLRQARSWSPRSRRRMKAEVMQWQAAIATVEAERTRAPSYHPPPASGSHMSETPRLPASIQVPPRPGPTTSAAYASQLPLEESPASYMGAEDYGEDEGHDQDRMEEDEESESEEEPEYEGTSWVGFEETGPVLKPPR
ncbi:hypothetical protein F4809DRAFT_646730 [Biscogniauxia mediterranea]|nr:hypothetical protein F4809DRAFT_646730 [Biscogniauxia mediterranea]